MWSDDIDKKIQDAAGNHEPPFREEDWNRMKVLLDEHLPQEKKKRPFLFGLFSLLLIGLPAWVMLTTYKERPSIEPVTQKTATVLTENNSRQTETTTAIKEKPALTTGTGMSASLPVVPASVPPAQPITPVNLIQRNNTGVTTINTNQQKKRRKQRTENSGRKDKADPVSPVSLSSVPGTSVSRSSSLNDPAGTSATAVATDTNNNSSTTEKETPGTDPVSSAKEQTQKDSLPEEKPVSKNKKPGDRKGGKWEISFSTGPDLSLVGVDKTGKWKMQYGLGISYAINKRFRVRTGFMVSRKLYYADSSDYHPPKGFWDYYTNLRKIDANCLVYEIPLNVVYSFPSAKRHQWFVSGGLSSYLMKEETYDYYFKDASGVDQYRERSVHNQNHHFLSILQLSGGYQYTLSDKFSLMAEPYMKLPLGGVGFGKVKLNNAGVLFTFGFKPFIKSK